MATKTGTNGNDRIFGGDGNDILNGLGGDDFIVGRGGDDIIDPGTGRDVVAGGAGNDTFKISSLTYTGAVSIFDGGNGIDTADFSFTGAALSWRWDFSAGRIKVADNSFSGVERMVGGSGKDSFLFVHADKAFTIEGRGGDDRIIGGNLHDIYHGGDGNDFIKAEEGDRAFGDAGNDLFEISSVRNGTTIDGGSGVDTILVGGGSQIIDLQSADPAPQFVSIENAEISARGDHTLIVYGTEGANRLINIPLSDDESAAVRLYGRGGNDVLQGAANADELNGDAGSDRIYGGEGADRISGGTGNDVLLGEAGDDRIDGGAGTDTASFERSATGVVANLSAGTASGEGADRLIAIENVRGTNNADSLTGNSAANKLDGLASSDALIGGGGNDSLDGGSGNDVLRGSLGSDALKGGAGLDSFVFDTAPGTANVDRVLDFSAADDSFSLARSIFTRAGASGVLAAAAFRQGAAAADASDRIIYDSATGKIFYDSDGTGAAAQILFATVTAGTPLTSADFLIFG